MKTKTIRYGGASRNPQDITDLDTVVDAYPLSREQVYTWKGSKFTWQAEFDSQPDSEDDNTATVTLSRIRPASYTNEYRAGGFYAEAHPATGQWLARTPEGFSVVASPEAALDEISRVYEALPPERTSTITVTGIVLRHGVDDRQFAKDLAAHFRHSRYTSGTVTARQVKITQDGKQTS